MRGQPEAHSSSVFASHSLDSCCLWFSWNIIPQKFTHLRTDFVLPTSAPGPMSFTLTIEPHRESWRRDFENEATLIRAALGLILKTLHHIGSTAVPGIHAKPIIDMLAEVESLESIDAHREGMEALGYEVMGEFGIPGRRYFRKDNGSGIRTHQIHAFTSGSPHLVRHLAFRDYLRSHPGVAREYDALKLRLIVSCQGDVERYIEGKQDFVQQVEREAWAWFSNRL
jgi:GrpB-like predicted nucleotidyltransferase (UPF0157 family)